MKIELSIKTTYLPNWGVWEGLREIVQNAQDAKIEHYGDLKVDYRNGTVRIENTGVRLPYEALLLGHSSKEGRDDLIGKFGEGLKLGLLALVRAGRKVKIRSGGEVWTPAIERSSKFDADVLVVDIQKGRADKNRVRIEVLDVTKDEWTELRDRMLFLKTLTKDEAVETLSGDLLLGEHYKGRIYVKGIYVQTDPSLNYGYNYRDASLDRDRKMVDSWDKKWRNSRIWKLAASQRPDLFDKFFALVENGEEDIEEFKSEYTAADLDDELKDKFAAKFKEQFGEDAIPVENIEQSKDIEHLGKRGVVVKPHLQKIVQQRLGSPEKVAQELREEVTETHSWHDLNLDERHNLESAVDYIKIGTGDDALSLSDFDVVDFRSDDLMGQFKDEKYLIAKKHLADRDVTLEILVHEVAHEHGGDGDKNHVAAIEGIWAKIVKHLRDSV
jgi:hypothetical protein